MYLLHFSTVRQNAFIVQTRYSLDLGFVFLTYSFSSCHMFSIGLASGDSGGERHQFTPLSSNKFTAHFDVHMFGVIILEQSVRSRQLVSDEREKGLFNYLAESNSIHYAFKNTNPSPALATYSSPHMHFYGMLWSA